MSECLIKMPAILMFVFINIVSSLDIGDKCRLNSNLYGVCDRIHKCPTAIKRLHFGFPPEVCGFKGKEPIICCSKHEKSYVKVPKSVLKCREYGKIISKIRRIHVRDIVGGTRSEPQEFSQMAALGYDNGNSTLWLCGGTLISDQYVLTAAHCLTSREYGDVRTVRLGDFDLDSTEDNAIPEDFDIIERIAHPGHKPSSKYNDIALIKLSRKVKFSRYVHPACLYTEPTINSPSLTAIGFGPARFENDTSNSLLKVDLDLFPDAKCIAAYKNIKTLRSGILLESQICAGGINKIKDTCKGDSGGPLLLPSQYHRNLYFVVGVTSFGYLCGILNTPGVYSRVSHYVPWIENIVWP